MGTSPCIKHLVYTNTSQVLYRLIYIIRWGFSFVYKCAVAFYLQLQRECYAKRSICRRRVCMCVCVSVCLSVFLSHSGIVSKRLNVKQRRTIGPWL